MCHPNGAVSSCHPNIAVSPCHPNGAVSSCHPNTAVSSCHPNTAVSPCHPNAAVSPCHPNTAVSLCHLDTAVSPCHPNTAVSLCHLDTAVSPCHPNTAVSPLPPSQPCTRSLHEINLSNNRVGDSGLMQLKLPLLANRSVAKIVLINTKVTCEGVYCMYVVPQCHTPDHTCSCLWVWLSVGIHGCWAWMCGCVCGGRQYGGVQLNLSIKVGRSE